MENRYQSPCLSHPSPCIILPATSNARGRGRGFSYIICKPVRKTSCKKDLPGVVLDMVVFRQLQLDPVEKNLKVVGRWQSYMQNGVEYNT